MTKGKKPPAQKYEKETFTVAGGLTGTFFGVVSSVKNGSKLYTPVEVKFHKGRLLGRRDIAEPDPYKPIAFEKLSAEVMTHHFREEGWNDGES